MDDPEGGGPYATTIKDMDKNVVFLSKRGSLLIVPIIPPFIPTFQLTPRIRVQYLQPDRCRPPPFVAS